MAAYSGGILDWSLTRSWRYRLPTAAARGDGATAQAPELGPIAKPGGTNLKWPIGKVAVRVFLIFLSSSFSSSIFRLPRSMSSLTVICVCVLDFDARLARNKAKKRLKNYILKYEAACY